MKSLAKVFFLVPLLSLFFFSLTVWAGCQFRCSMLRKRIWYHLFDTQVTWSSAVRLAPADSNTVCVVSLSGRFFSCPHRTTVILRQTGENRRHHISFFNYFQFWSLLEQDELGKHWGGKKKKKKSAESAHACVQQRVPCEFPRNECGNCKFARKAAIWEDSVLRQLSTRGRDGTCGSCDMTSTYLESCFLIKHQEKLAGKHILYSLFSLHQRKNVTKSKNNHSHTPACLRPNNGWLCFFKKEKKKH